MLSIYCIPTSPDSWCARCARNLQGVAPLPDGKYHLQLPVGSTSEACRFKPVEQSKAELRGPL